MDIKTFREKYTAFLKENNLSASDASIALGELVFKEEQDKLQEKVNKNEKYLGKYFVEELPKSIFPKMNKYYYVVSYKSIDENCVECLTFEEEPTYWFEDQLHKKVHVGDMVLGRFKFRSFEIEHVPIYKFKTMQETDSDKFNKKAKEYINKLLTLEWFTSHYRFGGKLPSDKDWKKE